MSDFSTCSVSSDYRMTINDDTAANASSKCYHDQVFFSFSGTLPHLTKSCYVGIISNNTWETCEFLQFFFDFF